MSASHTLRDFSQAIQNLQSSVNLSSSLARQQLAATHSAIFSPEPAFAHSIIADDNPLDDLESLINQQGVSLISSFSPVANDLREILALIRMGSIFERIGDECVTIARRSLRLHSVPEIRQTRIIEPLHQLAINLFDEMAFMRSSHTRSITTKLHAQSVDLQNAAYHAIRKLSEFSPDLHALDQRTALCELVFIARAFQNIAEDIQFILEELLELDTTPRLTPAL